MKRLASTALALLMLCPIAKADLDIRELTPEKAKELGWEITAKGNEGHVTFLVQPPRKLLDKHVSAHLSVRQGDKLIVHCQLAAKRAPYLFSVAKDFLADSTFELNEFKTVVSLGRPPTVWRVKLARFAQ